MGYSWGTVIFTFSSVDGLYIELCMNVIFCAVCTVVNCLGGIQNADLVKRTPLILEDVSLNVHEGM
jgi:hypothetical protein